MVWEVWFGRFGLVGLFLQFWSGRFSLVSLVWQVWFGEVGLVCSFGMVDLVC